MEEKYILNDSLKVFNNYTIIKLYPIDQEHYHNKKLSNYLVIRLKEEYEKDGMSVLMTYDERTNSYGIIILLPKNDTKKMKEIYFNLLNCKEKSDILDVNNSTNVKKILKNLKCYDYYFCKNDFPDTSLFLKSKYKIILTKNYKENISSNIIYLENNLKQVRNCIFIDGR